MKYQNKVEETTARKIKYFNYKLANSTSKGFVSRIKDIIRK